VWGGSADFAASAAPYVFAFHLAMGVRLVGSAPSRFGAGGGGGGGPSEPGPGNDGEGKWKGAAKVLRCWRGVGGGVG
jgi:hypothetical protein